MTVYARALRRMPRSWASSGVVTWTDAPPGRLTLRPSREDRFPISAMKKDCSLGFVTGAEF
jgi:hypothetical protein